MVGEDCPNDSHAHAAAGAGRFARTDQKRDGRTEAVDVYGKDVHQLNETPFEGSKGSEVVFDETSGIFSINSI